LNVNHHKKTITISLPFYSDLKIACGNFQDGFSEYTENSLKVENNRSNLDPHRHFIVKASGDSMNGGRSPIYDGDYLLFEINEGGTISNQLFAIELQDEYGDTSYVLKRIEKDAHNKYRLVSTNKEYQDISVDTKRMFPFARLKYKLKSVDVPGANNHFCEFHSF